MVGNVWWGWDAEGGRCGTCGRLWIEDRSSLFKTTHISELRYCATIELSNEVKVSLRKNHVKRNMDSDQV